MNDSYLEFNINDCVKVKLTNVGKEILARHWGKEELPEWYKNCTDKYGWISFQLHDLMHIFGQYTYIGNMYLPFKTTILINTKDMKNANVEY